MRKEEGILSQAAEFLFYQEELRLVTSELRQKGYQVIILLNVKQTVQKIKAALGIDGTSKTKIKS